MWYHHESNCKVRTVPGSDRWGECTCKFGDYSSESDADEDGVVYVCGTAWYNHGVHCIVRAAKGSRGFDCDCNRSQAGGAAAKGAAARRPPTHPGGI